MKTLVLALGLMLATMASASAALVIEGEISDSTEVDWIYFSVVTPGTVTIDVLALEENGAFGDFSYDPIDLNGDGEFSFLDPYIRLYPDLPVLTTGDEIAENDDGYPDGAGDGSTHEWDSWLSLELGAGDYILILGAYSLTASEAIAQYNSNAGTYGDYRVTITGAREEPVIPEPATMALIGLGLTGLAASRRRRKA